MAARDLMHGREEREEEEEGTAEPIVRLHYPKPEPLAHVIDRLAKVMDVSFVMAPELNRPIQIFCHHPIPSSEALKLLSTALLTVDLRLIVINDHTLKVAERQPDSGFSA